MQINMYAARVRFVRDDRGPLESKAQRTVVVLACDHDEAAQKARAHFAEVAKAGVWIEVEAPRHLPDAFALEAFVFASNS